MRITAKEIETVMSAIRTSRPNSDWTIETLSPGDGVTRYTLERNGYRVFNAMGRRAFYEKLYTFFLGLMEPNT